LYDGDLPVILGHVMGIPVEESVLQLASASTAITAVAVVGRTSLGRLLTRLRRR
jgi:hypothetical protein